MAKKGESDVEEDVEESEEEAAARAVEAASRKKKLVLLAIVGVVLLLIAGGGTWYALHLLNGGQSSATKTSTAKATADKGNKGKKPAKPKHKEAVYDVFDPAFLANYEVGGQQHYLQMSLAVMAREKSAIDAVNANMPLLRNRVVMLLSGEQFEQLQTNAGRVHLQQQLLAAMQEILKKETGKPQIEQVFFTNFVMQ